jgi:hypothetical protein
MVNVALWFVALAVVSYIRGFVLSWLWYWFVVPFGLPLLSITWAMGFSLTVGYLTQNPDNQKEIDAATMTSQVIAMGIIFPLFVLCFGWFIHGLM